MKAGAESLNLCMVIPVGMLSTEINSNIKLIQSAYFLGKIIQKGHLICSPQILNCGFCTDVKSLITLSV